jgi:threonine dehydratase
VAAMRMIFERMKLVVEPSSAIALAAVLKYREAFDGRRVGIVLTGGNVDLDKYFCDLP